MRTARTLTYNNDWCTVRPNYTYDHLDDVFKTIRTVLHDICPYAGRLKNAMSTRWDAAKTACVVSYTNHSRFRTNKTKIQRVYLCLARRKGKPSIENAYYVFCRTLISTCGVLRLPFMNFVHSHFQHTYIRRRNILRVLYDIHLFLLILLPFHFPLRF